MPTCQGKEKNRLDIKLREKLQVGKIYQSLLKLGFPIDFSEGKEANIWLVIKQSWKRENGYWPSRSPITNSSSSSYFSDLLRKHHDLVVALAGTRVLYPSRTDK